LQVHSGKTRTPKHSFLQAICTHPSKLHTPQTLDTTTIITFLVYNLTQKTGVQISVQKCTPTRVPSKDTPVLEGLRHFAIFKPLKLALTAVKLLTRVHHKALCRGHFKAKRKTIYRQNLFYQ
jgi:hypothetical protein